MIPLVFVPLRSEGKLLMPVGGGKSVVSDYLHLRRAVVAVCDERGWMLHHRSKALTRCVTGEVMPVEVVRTSGGMLLGVWKAELLNAVPGDVR